MQPFDKALQCRCFGNVKKFQGSLGKKWGHAKRVQKSDILTTCGFQKCRIGLRLFSKKEYYGHGLPMPVPAATALIVVPVVEVPHYFWPSLREMKKI